MLRDQRDELWLLIVTRLHPDGPHDRALTDDDSLLYETVRRQQSEWAKKMAEYEQSFARPRS